MSKSTTIVTSTTALSAIADTIRSDAETRGAIPSKQHLLNTFAKGIAGPKHDWGFLTGSEGPVIQKGLPEARIADLSEIAGTQPLPRPALVLADPEKPCLEIRAKCGVLYTAEMADYLDRQFTGDFLCIVEDFSTEGDYEDVQCMFEPAAIHAAGESLIPRSLWGATPEIIERTGRAYFAAAASADVNDLIKTTVADMDAGLSYKAFHFPHALVITLDYPFSAMDHDGAEIEEVIQVIVDESLSPVFRTAVLAEVESFLNRLARFLDAKDETWLNISIT